MRNRWRFLANVACALVLATGAALAAPAVAPLAPPEPQHAKPSAKPLAKPLARSKSTPKRAAVHNSDALELGGTAEIVDNYELGASVGGSDVPGSTQMDQEIDGIVNKITKPPESKKGLASPPAKVPEAALPRKSRAPAPVAKKAEPAPTPATPTPTVPARARPAVPFGETGAIADHAMIGMTSSLSPSLSKIELAALAAMMFPRPKWRVSSQATDAAAYFRVPRGH